MNRTKIPWALNPDGSPGYSLNPITGCWGPDGSVDNPKRCPWCYAWELAQSRLCETYLANTRIIAGGRDDPFAPRLWADRLYIPEGRKPKGIFMCDMSDMLGDWVPDYMVKDIVVAMKLRPTYRFYVLTKNPKRLAEFNPWPENVWVGATATHAQACFDAVKYLAWVEATTTYISFEPLLEPILNRTFGYPNAFPGRWTQQNLPLVLRDAGISWAITGPLNGKLAHMHPCNPEWLEQIRTVCDEAGVALFEKPECGQLLNRPLRQEFPK